MTILSLSCFGNPCVELDDQPVHIANQKALALLIYLAVTGSTQRRDHLATLLWPERRQRRARTYLRQALHALTQALDNRWFSTSRETISLCADTAVQMDVLRFQAALSAVEKVEEDKLTRVDVTQLEAAVTYYRDGFLAGFSLPDCPQFDRWCHVQSESLRRQLAKALQILLGWYATRCAYDVAIAHAQRWLALDPLHEAAHRVLMRLYAHSGRRAAAVRQYEQCVGLLDDELGVAPDEQTRALYADIQAGRLSTIEESTIEEEVRTNKATAPPHNLPCPPTPLIGRAKELADLAGHLTDPQVRLITIVGAGGMGKSRLALAAAEHVLAHFPDGVYYVPLVGLDSSMALAPTVAAAVGLDDTGNGSDRQRLVNFLRDKDLLLLLDNCEHLLLDNCEHPLLDNCEHPLDAADWLAELLQTAPHLTLLATSRQRLALQEEWQFPLQGLDYPPSDGEQNSADYPALELFAQCARKVRPDFSVTEEWDGVAAICRAVEGMPLGIELAATWVRMMSCAAIAAELATDLDFLSTSLRNLPEQHRSLRTVFERSWRLLARDEQQCLCRLSIFRGGFDKKAAAAVAGAEPQLLSRLVDSSLVRWQPESIRFDMHELLRQFAAEKLASAPTEHAQARQRHCDYYGAWVSQMNWFLDRTKPETEPRRHRESFQQVAADIDNVRIAWQWAVEQRDANIIRQMMNMLVQYCDEAGAWDAGRQEFDAAIDAFRSADSLPEAQRASLVGALLLRRTWFMEGHVETAEHHQLLAESLDLLRRGRQGESVDAALALVRLGAKSGGLGRSEEGAAYLAQALSIFRKQDHTAGIGHTLKVRGTLAIGWGRLAESARFLTQAVEYLEERNRTMYWWTQHLLGVTCMMQGRYQQAQTRLEGARSYFAQLHPEHGTVAYATRNLGDLATAIGDFAGAQRYFTEAKSRFADMGQGWLISIPMVQGPGDLARLQGNWNEAERVLEENVATARRIGFDQRIAINLRNLGRLRCEQGKHREAKEILDEALVIARRIDYRFALALVLCQLGHTAAGLNEPATWDYYAEALQIAQDEQIARVAVDTMRGVAEQVAEAGELERSVELLALVVDHSAGDWEAKDRARQRLSELEANLASEHFAAAVERGKALDLREVADPFLYA